MKICLKQASTLNFFFEKTIDNVFDLFLEKIIRGYKLGNSLSALVRTKQNSFLFVVVCFDCFSSLSRFDQFGVYKFIIHQLKFKVYLKRPTL